MHVKLIKLDWSHAFVKKSS